MAFLFLSILKAYSSTEWCVEIVTTLLVFCYVYAANLEIRCFKGLNFALKSWTALQLFDLAI